MNLVAFVGTQTLSSASCCDNSKTLSLVMFLPSPQNRLPNIYCDPKLNKNMRTYILRGRNAPSVQVCIFASRISYAGQGARER
jgi:hypothetical protein